MRPLAHFRKHARIIAAFLLLEIVLDVGIPSISYALTSGPNQPEFSSFEPVATTNMVNEFTGDFTYNIPLLEVPGPHGSSYPLSLSYHSGVNQEEEASWVGYGWTLNPGAINRNTRGFPDDMNGKNVTFHNKSPKNWTVAAGYAIAPELFGKDKSPIKLNLSHSLRYNNYRGFGFNQSLGAAFGMGIGRVSLGYSLSESGDIRPSFSYQLSPAAILSKFKVNSITSKRLAKTENGRILLADVNKKLKNPSIVLLGTSNHSIFTFNDFASPTTASAYTGGAVNFTVGFLASAPAVPAGVSPNIFGSYTWQKNVDNVSKPAFGYLYSADAGTDGIMDYQIEKDNEYNKTDVFLGMPFNTADNFIASGEGIGGGFRLHHKSLGHFGPRHVSSSMTIANVGGEIDLGPALFGGGFDVGAGSQKMTVKDWKRLVSGSSFSSRTSREDEPVFFRFNGDIGGEWGTAYDDRPISPRFSGKDPAVPSALLKPNAGNRSARNSYINYHTNAEFSTANYKTFSRSAGVNLLANRINTEYQDLIGEIGVFSDQGLRYVYGLPVYNKNEKQLTYGVQGAQSTDIENGYLVYHESGKTLVGEETNAPYAGSYLITEINTPDYVDRKLDGPTQDDFGGYTRFNYRNGLSTGNWYKWRIPYKGLQYARNSQSDPMDDMGSKSEGERQVYYLQTIETKTHVAFFYTSDRVDGFEAPVNDRSGDPSGLKFSKTPTPGTDKLKKLDKISIYAIESLSKDPITGLLIRNSNGDITEPAVGIKPIKTVHFEYHTTGTLSLCKGAPNVQDPSTGKLTLKRIYFEYNGITQTRISPYQFEYTYPNYATYPVKYRNGGTDDVTNEFDNMTAVQNPNYNPFNIDAWGYHQPDGQTRYTNMEKWVDQKTVEGAAFDPAAWHLKVIKLPSGGEIHVQYEQDDYQYVQDQEAHVMAKLSSGSGNGFYVDVSSVMPTLTPENRLLIRDLIHKRYVNTGNKIYFKFLYTLMGNGVPVLSSCNAEFIEGYATVTGATVSGNFIYLSLLQDTNSKTPAQICTEFVKANRIGKLDPSRDCNPNTGISDGTDAKGLINNLYNMAKSMAAPPSFCLNLNPAHSYFRIPTSLPKKGGGLRVKRLMMYDKGLENNAVLYGNEYVYKTKDANGRVISSGVATNEPVSMREENILVDFIARGKQSFKNRLIAGRDKELSEGPIGESIYPGASVGYSKVTVKNIHSGKTNPGFSVTEFFTAKDFPVIAQMTDIRSTKEHKYRPLVLINITKDKVRAMQGFSFILNDMHGQLKRKATYSGTYADVLDLTKSILVSEQAYEYFKPGEKIPVQNRLFGATTLRNPGREVDLTFAQKAIEEKMTDVNIEGDFSIGFFGIFGIPYLTAIPSMNNVEGELFTHASTKVVRYPALVKKVKSYQDGILHTTENLAFDEMTGRQVAVRSFDEMKGAYLAQEMPAGWEYPAFTSKSRSEGKFIQKSTTSGSSLYINFDYKTITEASIYFSGEKSCFATAEFTVGDLVDLGQQQLYHVSQISFASDQIDLVKSGEATLTAKPDGEVLDFTILRSGKNNRINENAGSVTFHNESASGISVATQSLPESSRYVYAGTNADDGSLFVNHLNQAFNNRAVSQSAILSGPYNRINMTQYTDKLPVTCAADLSDATVRNVTVVFKTIGGEVSIQMASFEVKCDATTWITISNQ